MDRQRRKPEPQGFVTPHDAVKIPEAIDNFRCNDHWNDGLIATRVACAPQGNDPDGTQLKTNNGPGCSTSLIGDELSPRGFGDGDAGALLIVEHDRGH